MKYRLRNLTLNERRLTELVFRSGKIARVDLAEAADMTVASVTRLVSGLMEFALFKEDALKDGGRGQPKKMLSLNRDRFCAVGVYLFAKRIEAVLVDFDGSVLSHVTKSILEMTAGDLVDLLQSTTKELIASPQTNGREFLGVGLGLPGNFGSVDSYVQAHASFRGMNGLAIKDAIQKVGEFPVFLENDGTASALGEYLFGNHDHDSLFLLHIGYGLGGGAVVNGRPFRGHQGNACLPGALYSYKGSRPTLPDLERYVEAQNLNPDKILFGADQLPAGDIRLARWLEKAAEELQLAVRIISGMFDPPLIVLGGALPAVYLQDLAHRLSKADIEGPSAGLNVAKVVATVQGDLNGPIGAASIPLFRSFFPGSIP